MTKKEICLSNLSFAYYSGFGGLEVKFIETASTIISIAFRALGPPRNIITN